MRIVRIIASIIILLLGLPFIIIVGSFISYQFVHGAHAWNQLTVNCEYNKDMIFELVLQDERYYLKREFNNLQISEIKEKREGGKQITFILSNLTDTQFKKVKSLSKRISNDLKTKVKKDTHENILFTISINEKKVANNFLWMFAERTVKFYDNFESPVRGMVLITDEGGKARFRFPMGQKYISKQGQRNQKMWVIKSIQPSSPANVKFKFLKHIPRSDESELRDEEENASVGNPDLLKRFYGAEFQGGCLLKKEIFSEKDIKYIHTGKKNGEFYLAIGFNSPEETKRIHDAIEHFPQRQVVFLLEGEIFGLFDYHNLIYISDEDKSGEIKLRYPEKEGKKVAVLIKYGRYDVSMKPIEGSAELKITMVGRILTLLSPVARTWDSIISYPSGRTNK